jgi:hypothetical protein
MGFARKLERSIDMKQSLTKQDLIRILVGLHRHRQEWNEQIKTPISEKILKDYASTIRKVNFLYSKTK